MSALNNPNARFQEPDPELLRLRVHVRVHDRDAAQDRGPGRAVPPGRLPSRPVEHHGRRRRHLCACQLCVRNQVRIFLLYTYASMFS